VKKLLPLFIALSAVFLFLPPLAAQRQVFTTGTPAELARARSIGLGHLRAIASRKRIDRPDDLVVSRTDVDRRAMAHTRVQQFHRGVPVFGGEAIAHLNPDGGIFAETDNLVPDLAVDTTPRLTQAAAIAIAVADYGCSTCLTEAPGADVWILRDEFGADHLAFRVQLTRLDGTGQTALPVRFVDAHSGAVVLAYDNLQTGSGNSLYSGTVTIGTSFNDVATPNHPVGWYMENLVRRVGTFDIRNGIFSGTTSVFRFIDDNDIWNGTNQRAAVDAQFGAERYLDYLQSVHGRNGIDGSGGPSPVSAHDGSGGLMTAIVHFGSGYNNAFWDPQRLLMVYGDGDGVDFSPLVSVDIAGHEMTHGLTQYTAGLIYNGESGALNESWSDVFGAMLERHVRGESPDTWLIAEQAITPGVAGDALRYMHDPHLASNFGFTADDDPDHYAERYTGTDDNGGVHINSTIASKAFYLLAKGGSHHLGGSMTGIGADQAAEIWFTALTSFMTSGTNFAGARSATMLAAAALYGSDSPQEQAVSSAWCLVGVGACPTVQAISVTPNSGSGATQAFTLRYSNSLGAADLSKARVRFGADNVDPGTCTASYNATNGVVELMNDAGTAWISGTMGGAPLSNSQCTLNLAGSSATPNGNDLTVVLNITFSGSFTGLKQIYMMAKSAGGVSTGWIQRGTWMTNAPAGPFPVSVTPGVGLGTPQAFLFQYTDSSGAANLTAVKLRFGASNVNPGTCTARYRPRAAGVIDLLDDAGTAWITGTLGGAPISNSQCTLNLAGSAATASGNDLTVLLNISFSASFVGDKTIFMLAKNASQKSGWLTRGTWTVPVPGPNAASVTPSSGAGLAQAFMLQYSDSAGAANLASARVRFGASNVGSGTCTARYKPAGGIVELMNDAGTAWASGTIGTGTLANSQCTLKLASSSAMPNGAILTVVLDITFSATFVGQKTTYMLAKNAGGVSTGWQQRGTWTVAAP
jgi:thermolysin